MPRSRLTLPAKEWKEQEVLFTHEKLLPKGLPRPRELKPCRNLGAVFDDCHNHIYANEGILKERIFHEIVKLLVMKLHDERHPGRESLRFGITANEYGQLLADIPSTFEPRMNLLFQEVQQQFTDHFANEILNLKPLTLAYIVERLQFISLSETPGDIKGEAFQTFVNRHQRGDRGEFFTPHPLVRLAVEMIDPKPVEFLIDPACGSGGFLIQSINHISDKYKAADRAQYIRDSIRGIEFNPDIALAASVRIAFEGGDGQEIVCANSLVRNDSLKEVADVILTNPPFGSKGKIEDQRILGSYALARRWRKLADNHWTPTDLVLTGQSPEILFIERCLQILKPGGRMAIVLPDGILQNVSNEHIRYWIRKQANVLAIVSIPQEAFVPYGTGIKTSILYLQKKAAGDSTSCFMAIMKKTGYDVKGKPIYKRDSKGKFAKSPRGVLLPDDDIEEIANSYSAFCKDEFRDNMQNIYIIRDADLNTRLDVEHYKPADQSLIEQLKTKGAKKLHEIADILTEGDDFRLGDEGEIRYIAISDLDARTMMVTSQQRIRIDEAPSRATYRVCKGDIITAIAGASTGTTRHASALITDEEDGAICSNGFAVLRNFRGIEPLFLLAYLRTDLYLRQVRRLMTGHAIPAISLDDLSGILVPIPPAQEQMRIAQSVELMLGMNRNAMRSGEKIIHDATQLINTMDS